MLWTRQEARFLHCSKVEKGKNFLSVRRWRAETTCEEGMKLPPFHQVPFWACHWQGQGIDQHKQAETGRVRKGKSLSTPEKILGHHEQQQSGSLPLAPPLMGLHKYLPQVQLVQIYFQSTITKLQSREQRAGSLVLSYLCCPPDHKYPHSPDMWN